MKMLRVCNKLDSDPHFWNLECEFSRFREWIVNKKNDEFPVPESKFDALMVEYALKENRLTNGNLGFMNGKLVYYKIRFMNRGY